MLDVGQFLGKKAAMMIVNELDGTNDFRVSGEHRCRQEMIANEVAKRLRPIRVALVGDEAIKCAQKRSVSRNTGATQLRHNRSLTLRWDYEHWSQTQAAQRSTQHHFRSTGFPNGWAHALLTVNLLPAKFAIQRGLFAGVHSAIS